MTHDHAKDLMRINNWRKIIYKNICMDAELSRHTLRAIFHQNELLHYIIVIKTWTNVIMTEDDVCFEEKNDWSENDELSQHANIWSTINSSCMVGRKSVTPRTFCHFYSCRSRTLCRCIYSHVNKCVKWRWTIKIVSSLYIITDLPMYSQSC